MAAYGCEGLYGIAERILMKKQEKQQRLLDVNDGVDTLLKEACWAFLDVHLSYLIPMVWRMDVEELLVYAKVTLGDKKYLPSRAAFIMECKLKHPNKKLWKGLE
jgi:hypothetical protein